MIHRCIYEDVVRAFYSSVDNMYHRKKSDKKFKTNIRESLIEVTLTLINNHFGIPLDGEDYASWTQDYVQTSKEVIGDDSLTSKITDTTSMDLNTRKMENGLRLINLRILGKREDQKDHLHLNLSLKMS